MTGFERFSVFCGFLFTSVVCASEDQRLLKVDPGQDVPLQCPGPRGASVVLLEWNRPDLKSDGYVFFYRNKRSFENYQHPSFRGRVQLSDPQMKDGDFSVVLNNVTIDDTGTYECQVIVIRPNETTRSEIRHHISLTVTASAGRRAEMSSSGGNSDGNPLVVVGSVLGVLLVLAVVFIVFQRKRKPEERPYKVTDQTAEVT
ncbi:Coxsackievirus and adenovirus receptor-like protein [Larimichthys crocea]|nr:Coxsackievirus and adenovirus receptor-like protein [Larimichthys crocea]